MNGVQDPVAAGASARVTECETHATVSVAVPVSDFDSNDDKRVISSKSQLSVQTNAEPLLQESRSSSPSVPKSRSEEALADPVGQDVCLSLLQRICDQLKDERARKWEARGKILAFKTSPYCPKKGIHHAELLHDNIEYCPDCGQVLDQAQLEKMKPPESSDSESSNGDSKSEGRLEEADDQPISHLIKYLDKDGDPITVQSWPEMFELGSVRHSLAAQSPSQSVFEVLTVLSTSIQASTYSRWYEDDVERVLSAGILDNPKIKVAVKSVTITIKSVAVVKAIAKVSRYYPSVNLESDSLKCEEPFTIIGHNIRELEALSTDLEDKGTLKSDELTSAHLRLLLEFIKEKIYHNGIEEEEARHSRGSCTFQMLWLLFKPGTTVYMDCNGRFAAYVVQSVECDESVLRDPMLSSPYIINMWNLDFDGRYVGRLSTSITIAYFEGEREITSLKVFPSQFMDKNDGGKLRRSMEDRGKRWYQFLRGAQVYHSGELCNAKRQVGCKIRDHSIGFGTMRLAA